MFILYSNCKHAYFFQELKFYSKLVSKNSYCIVQNTLIKMLSKNKPWSKAKNPYTFDKQFLNKEKYLLLIKKITIR